MGRRLRERYRLDKKPTVSDGGIMVQLPDTLSDLTFVLAFDTPQGAKWFVFDPDEINPIVTTEVGVSALFTCRFRECAALTLLLLRRHPGRRSPL